MEDLTVKTGEVLNAHSEVLNNNTMMQTKTTYSTAVQIQKARTLQIVVAKSEEEASIAGDDFYYSWRQGGEIIEGITVGGALAIARNWGNCAVDCKIEETATGYIFNAAFIDLETGFNLVRPFRQNKLSPKKKDGSDIYTGERGKDIIFQIGASKAIRNVVLNAVPKWLVSKVLNKSKENISEKIEKMGKVKASEMLVKKLNALKIPIERVSPVYGNEKSWDTEQMVMLSGAIKSIESGYETVDSIFPNVAQVVEDKKENGLKPNAGVIEKPELFEQKDSK